MLKTSVASFKKRYLVLLSLGLAFLVADMGYIDYLKNAGLNISDCQDPVKDFVSKGNGTLMSNTTKASECQQICIEMDPKDCVGFNMFKGTNKLLCYEPMPCQTKIRLTYITDEQQGAFLFILDRRRL